MKFLRAVLVFGCLGHLCRSISGETFPQCENLESGAFVGGTSGCKSYIYCDGEDSYEGMCPSQLLFNTKDGSCAPPSDVNCDDNKGVGAPTTTPSPTKTTSRTTTTTTTTTTATTTTTPIRTTTTTKATTIRTSTTKAATTKKIATSSTVTTTPSWISPTEVPAIDEAPIESVEEIPEEYVEVPTESEESFIVAESTTRAPRTTVSVGVSTTRPATSCPDIDRPNEVVFLPSEVSCNEYFVCYHGTPMTMSCSGQLYFDYISAKCELPERANCLIANTSTPSPRKQCTVNTFDYFPYPSNCNYFYKCMNGFLSLQQCPIGFGWADEMKLCVKLAKGKCPIGRLEWFK